MRSKDKIQNIINLQDYYDDYKRKPAYWAFPEDIPNTYNCNSFSHGLLNAANITCDKPEHKVPGWDIPLDKSYFEGENN